MYIILYTHSPQPKFVQPVTEDNDLDLTLFVSKALKFNTEEEAKEFCIADGEAIRKNNKPYDGYDVYLKDGRFKISLEDEYIIKEIIE